MKEVFGSLKPFFFYRFINFYKIFLLKCGTNFKQTLYGNTKAQICRVLCFMSKKRTFEKSMKHLKIALKIKIFLPWKNFYLLFPHINAHVNFFSLFSLFSFIFFYYDNLMTTKIFFMITLLYGTFGQQHQNWLLC